MLFKVFLSLLFLVAQPFVTAFTNPIKARDGSDPFMIYDQGYYYLTSTTWGNIQITRATTIAGLKTATPKVVWTDTTASRCCHVWAPEIHKVGGSWYIYYSAGASNTYDNQRPFVLKGSSQNIWDSTWTFGSQLKLPDTDVWAIDGTVLKTKSGDYFVYSRFDGPDQCLWIAKLTSPTTLGNVTVKISTPTYDWERMGELPVNEGPAPIYNGGRTWIAYSASHCRGVGYKLGQLELTGSDPMNPAHWTKKSTPIFVSANGQYQPGHNAFFTSPSGKQIWNVYHANHNSPGGCDGSRYTAVQPVNFTSTGDLDLGAPRGLSVEIPEPT